MSWRSYNPVWAGGLIWCLILLFHLPYSPYAHTQVHVLLIAAPLFLVPLCFQLLGVDKRTVRLSIVAGVLHALAFCMEQGAAGAALTVPWLLLVLQRNYQELNGYFELKLKALVRLAAFVYLLVGAIWSFFDRLGYTLLDFDHIIVLLTAVHFHYAGFLLTTLFYFSIDKVHPLFSKITGIGLLVGAPLVMLGIVGSQLGLSSLPESLGVTVMALTGACVGLAYLYLATKNRFLVVKILWSLAGLSLLAGMTLAMLYGWRAHHTLTFLSIPWMYAVHGTLNAVGFAIPGVIGQQLSQK